MLNSPVVSLVNVVPMMWKLLCCQSAVPWLVQVVDRILVPEPTRSTSEVSRTTGSVVPRTFARFTEGKEANAN